MTVLSYLHAASQRNGLLRLIADVTVVRYTPRNLMDLSDPRTILTISGVIAAVAALYVSWLRLRRIATTRAVLLLGLRTVLLLLLIAAVINPVLERQTQVAREPLLLVALDTSRSMTDLPLDGASRYAQATAALTDSPLTVALENARVERTLVADGVWPVTAFPSKPVPSTHTDLQIALSELLRPGRHRPPVACLLLSDGGDTDHRPAQRVAEALGAYEIPVYCLGVGSSAPVPDVSIAGLVAPESVAEGAQFELRALVRAAGLTNEPVELSLREGPRLLASRTLAPGERERSTRFDLTAGGPGAHRYVLEARCGAAEATAANNRRSVTVRVEPAEARILWIEGSPRREYTFLRRLLLGIEDVDVTILLRKRDPADFWRDDAQPRRAALSSVGELSRYRAVILSNVDAAGLGGGFVSQLADYVTGGGALAMLGGPNAFGAGGWAGTPVADVLPVRIAPGEGLLADPISMRLSGEGDLARTLGDSGIEHWGRLPLLEGMNAVGGAAANAEIALQAGPGAAGAVLAGRRFGAGRTLAVTVDDTWRWRQSPSADAHSRAAWEALWTTVIGQLIAPRADRQVVLELGRDMFEVGEAIRADVHVTDEKMHPVGDATVRLEIRGDGGEHELMADPRRAEGVYRAMLQATETGEIRIRAVVERGGEALGEDLRTIEVLPPAGELTHAARPEVLQAIADETNGRYLPLHRAQEMADLLPLAPEMEQRTMRLRPARTWWFFAFVLTIAAADWLLRRRWGVG